MAACEFFMWMWADSDGGALRSTTFTLYGQATFDPWTREPPRGTGSQEKLALTVCRELQKDGLNFPRRRKASGL